MGKAEIVLKLIEYIMGHATELFSLIEETDETINDWHDKAIALRDEIKSRNAKAP